MAVSVVHCLKTTGPAREAGVAVTVLAAKNHLLRWEKANLNKALLVVNYTTAKLVPL